MFVKPAKEGLHVIDPTTYRVLAPEGGEVPENTYWLRRLHCGDVVESTPPKPGKTVPVEKTVGAD